MEHIIHHDISLLLYSISIQYKIDLDIMINRYLPTINIEKKTFQITRKNSYSKPRKPITIHPQHCRCASRIWNNGSVSFDSSSQSWTYGAQCSRLKFGQTKYCQTHLRAIQRNHGVNYQGDFCHPPPHPHFEKYKKNENQIN